MWSGSTVAAVARALVELALDPPKPQWVYHLATQQPISKASALRLLCEAGGLDRVIRRVDQPEINRGLANSLPGRHLPSLEQALGLPWPRDRWPV